MVCACIRRAICPGSGCHRRAKGGAPVLFWGTSLCFFLGELSFFGEGPARMKHRPVQWAGEGTLASGIQNAQQAISRIKLD